MEADNTTTKENSVREKSNAWVIVSAILGILVVVLIYVLLKGGNENIVSGEKAGADVVAYLNAQTSGGVEYVSNQEVDSLYKITVLYQGQNIPVYTTKDGKYFVQGVTLMNTSIVNITTPKVPKSDKPKVQVFIFSYCPYGLQFEKALLPVYDLLKNNADIDIVAIGAMHGEFEKTETLRQISIEQLYSRDKLFEYLKEFDGNFNISTCNGDATCLNKYLPTMYTLLGINKTKIENYMKFDAVIIYNQQGEEASSFGIGGSPTFVINGVEVQVSRTPDAIKTVVCSAFNTAPSECSQVLSTASPSVGFGSSTGSSDSSVQC